MQCEECELLISTMVDGEFRMPQSQDLFEHMALCAGCQDFLRSLLRIRNAERELISDGIAGRVSPARSADRGRSAHRILRQRISISVPSAAIALVMLVLWSVVLALTVGQTEGSGTRDAGGEIPQQPIMSPFVRPAADRPQINPR